MQPIPPAFDETVRVFEGSGAIAQPPTLADASRLWLKIGLISFGGPAGQIAILHEELVERRGWFSERSF